MKEKKEKFANLILKSGRIALFLPRRIQLKLMSDDKLQNELKEVHKKLEDIEKKQEMLQKIQDLDRDHGKKMGERPVGHSYEMM